MVLPANGLSCVVRRLGGGGSGGLKLKIMVCRTAYYVIPGSILLQCLMVYYIVSVLFLMFLSGVPAWRFI